MMKKSIVLIVAAAIMSLSGLALAQDEPAPGSGPGPGYGQGYGKGPGRGQGPMADFQKDPLVNQIQTQLHEKQREMFSLLQSGQVDEGRIKTLQQEINQLRNQLADKRLDHLLAFKKDNPDWKPRFEARRGSPGRGGPGRGGPGWHRQKGFGPLPRVVPPGAPDSPQDSN